MKPNPDVLSSLLRSGPSQNSDNFIIFEKSSQNFRECTFQELLNWQKYTGLESSDYVIIKGNFVKTFTDTGLDFLANMKTYENLKD